MLPEGHLIYNFVTLNPTDLKQRFGSRRSVGVDCKILYL